MARRRKRVNKSYQITAVIFLIVLLGFEIYTNFNEEVTNYLDNNVTKRVTKTYDLSTVPAYSDKAYVILNDNLPTFTDKEKLVSELENYSPLDELGRCGVATALVSIDTMPTEERGSIGKVKPTGWHTVKYDFVEGKYLYNRCHLIGYQLTGENANERNLITCTRYMNTVGMLEFENKVSHYVRETDNHVLYRVTPVFEDNNLVASGAIMEAYSIEDKGKLSFNVYVYNVQPNVKINYLTGESEIAK